MTADVFRAQLQRTTEALHAETAKSERLGRENAALAAELAALRAWCASSGAGGGVLDEGAASPPWPLPHVATSAPATRRSSTAPAAPHSDAPAAPLSLLADVVPPLSFARHSPAAEAALTAGDVRAGALVAWSAAVTGASREVEVHGVAYGDALLRLGGLLSALERARWANLAPGHAATAAASGTAGRALQDAGALVGAGAGALHAALAGLELDLSAPAERARAQRRAADAALEDGDVAFSRLMGLRRGVGARELLARSADAFGALQRQELARFDAAAASAALEARRRVATVERVAAAMGALANSTGQAAAALAAGEAGLGSVVDAAALARAQLPRRDGAWRAVRDSLETDLMRAASSGGSGGVDGSASGVGGGSGDGTPRGDDADCVDPGASGILASLLRQATGPLDRVSEAVRRASGLVATRIVPLDSGVGGGVGGGLRGVGADSSVDTSSVAVDDERSGGSARGVDELAAPSALPLGTHASLAATVSGLPEVPIAGWLWLHTRKGGGAALAAQGLGGGALTALSARWQRRWVYVRDEGPRGLRLYVVVPRAAALLSGFSSNGGEVPTAAVGVQGPVGGGERVSSGGGLGVLISELAVCNVREGTAEEEQAGGSPMTSGAIGVVSSGGGSAGASPMMSPGGFGSSDGGGVADVRYSGWGSSGSSEGSSGAIQTPGSSEGTRGSRFRAAAAGMSRAVSNAVDAARSRSGASSSGGHQLLEGPTPSGSSVTLAPDALPASYAVAHAFEVRTPGERWVFAAPTPAQRREWVRVLRGLAEQAVTNARGGGAVGTGSSGSAGTNSAWWGGAAVGVSGDGSTVVIGGAQAQGAGQPVGVGVVGATGQGTLAAVASKTHAAAEASAAAAALSEEQAGALLLRLDTAAHCAGDVGIALALARLRNPRCVDCGDSGPEWASLSHGAIFCLACSGVHRSLGVHVSKVRSLVLDEWEPPQCAVLLRLGNAVVNAELEGARAPGSKPLLTPATPRAERERVIRAKYEARAYMATGATDPSGDDDELPGRDLCAAAASADLPRMLRSVLSGVEPMLVHFAGVKETGKAVPLTTPLHVAARVGLLAPVALLVAQSAWGGEGAAPDAEGFTPLEALLAASISGGGPTLPENAYLSALVALLLPRRTRAAALAAAESACAAARAGDAHTALAVLAAERDARHAVTVAHT